MKDVFRIEIDWEDLIVGEHYTAEEKYHFQARDVLILDVEVSEQDDGDEYVAVEFKIIEPTYNATKGKTHKWGRSKKWLHYSDGKFKPLGSDLDYLTPGNTIDDYRYKNDEDK